MHKPIPSTSSRYYEATIQLRPKSSVLLEYVLNQLKLAKVGITDVEPFSYGYDLKISDKRILRALEKRLKARFQCTTIRSARIFTRDRQTSKDVYRATMLCKLKDQQK